MAQYLMAAQISGTRNGVEWPKQGQAAPDDLSEVEQRDMLVNGQIVEAGSVAGRRLARNAATYYAAVADNAALLAEQAAGNLESANIAAAEAERAAGEAEKLAAEARKASEAEAAKLPTPENATAAAASTTTAPTPLTRNSK